MAEPGAPMLYRIDVEKRLAEESWTNVYYGQSEPGTGLPSILAGQIVAAERAVHAPTVTITRARLSSTNVGDETYQLIPVNQAGTRVVTGSLEPLFVVVRCDFGTVSGRPSRKYLRGVITENDKEFTVLSPGTATFLKTNYVDVLVGLAGLVDVDNQEWVNGSVNPAIAMRQLRRRSRSKFDPNTGAPRA